MKDDEIKLNIEIEKDPSKIKSKIDLSSTFQQAAKEKQPVPTYVDVDIEKQFMTNIYILFESMRQINTYTDEQVKELVLSSYIPLLELTLRTNENPYYSKGILSIFSNERYINMLINVLNTNRLDFNHRVYLNHILYDYKTFKGKPSNSLITKLHNELANVANFDVVPKLLGAGLGKHLVTDVAVAKFSTFDPYIAVKRVNLVLFNSKKELSLQDIVNVYQYLFNTGVANLFAGVMFDVYSDSDLNNAEEYQRDIYYNMSLAVLELVNTMPTPAITTIISTYSMSAQNMPIRFSLRLSDDYYRINQVINTLTSQGIYVP